MKRKKTTWKIISRQGIMILVIAALLCLNFFSPVFAEEEQKVSDNISVENNEEMMETSVLTAESELKTEENDLKNVAESTENAILNNEGSLKEDNTSLEETIRIESIPSADKYDKLWVGDSIFIEGWIKKDNPNVYPNEYRAIIDYSILSGDGIEFVNDPLSPLTPETKSILFTKAGYKEVKATFKNQTGVVVTERIYEFKVIDRPAEVKINYSIPEGLKVGDSIRGATMYTLENLNYQGKYNVYQMSGFGEGWEAFLSKHAGDPLYGAIRVNEDRTGVGPGISSDSNGYKSIAYKPGDLDLSESYKHMDSKETIDVPCTLKIEDPIITDNAPQKIAKGTNFTLKTALTNLNAENKKVSDFKRTDFKYEKVDIPEYEPMHAIGYRPVVEVIEGQNLIEQSQQDYSNTLSSEENLSFKGTGTVKLKIKYEQINTCTMCMIDIEKNKDKRYNPEKIVTINVVDSPIKTITMKKNPTQMEYVEGSTFNPEGGVLLATYDNGEIKEIPLDNKDVICIVDLSKAANEVPVTVYYEGISTSFNVKVIPKSLESISISKFPRSEYLIGEALTLEKGELILTYNNNTSESLAMTDDNVTVTGYDKDKTGEQTLTLAYGGKTTEWKVTVVSRAAVDKVIEMINKINPDDLYESDRKTVYSAKEAYDKLGTQIEKDAVTNIEVLNKAIALFEAPFHSEDIVNNVTIKADGGANILPLKSRLTAKHSQIKDNQKQAILASFNNNPSMIGNFDLAYVYPERNGKDYKAVLTEGSQIHYSIPLNPSLVSNRAVNVAYVNAKGESKVLKSEYKEGILSFDSGDTGTFVFILTDVPAPIDPVSPKQGGGNTAGTNPSTAVFSTENGVANVAIGLGVLIVAGAAAYAIKKKYI